MINEFVRLWIIWPTAPEKKKKKKGEHQYILHKSELSKTK